MTIAPIMKTLQLSKSLLILIFIGTFMTSCSNEGINDTSTHTSISVKLSSSSELYSGVYLDVKDVQIQIDEDAQNSKSWMSLGALNSGVYDFSDMNDGAELILVQDMVIPVSHVYSVKLVLGDDNAMVMNNILYAIDTPEAANKESVNAVNRSLQANKSYEFTLDFEVDKSIQMSGMDVILTPKMNTEMRLYELF